MSLKDAEPRIAEIAAGQWGLLTTRQAAERGVSRLDLSRLDKAERVYRLAQGVYRIAGAPSTPFDDIRAAYLATDPGRLAWQRRDDDVIVGGATASWLHGVGDLQPEPFEFLTPTRRQTVIPTIRFRTRVVDPDDVRLVEGLPTTSIERTIADLVADDEDGSLVADVLRDAVNGGKEPNQTRLTELLAPLAERQGHERGDGAALYAELAESAGVDAARRMRNLAQHVDLASLVPAAVTDAVAAHVRQQLGPIDDLADRLGLTAQVRDFIAQITLTLPDLSGLDLPTNEIERLQRLIESGASIPLKESRANR